MLVCRTPGFNDIRFQPQWTTRTFALWFWFNAWDGFKTPFSRL